MTIVLSRSLRVLFLLGLTATILAAAGRSGLVDTVQAQSDDDRRKRDRDKQRPEQRQAPPPPKAPTYKPPPPSGEKPGARFRQDSPPPAPRRLDASPDKRRDDLKRPVPAPRKYEAAPEPKNDQFKRPPAAKVPAPATDPKRTLAPTGPAPKRFDDVQKGRLERVEDGGRRKVIQEPGNRFIVKQDNRTIIRHDDSERFRRRPDAKSERRADGTVETYYLRPDGTRVVTVVDANGRLLRRYRRGGDGREHNIIDNRRFYRNLGIGVGIGVLGIIALNLPPPHITIPRERYIVEYERASDDDLYETLLAPPVEELDRAYSLEEIRDNYELRARMRRIDLDTINFEFGSWEVPPDQYHKLERVARAMLRILRDNPDSVFLVEGHTDAVGSEDDNLSLSDRRASSVAQILSETFDVPPENLVTQGYGEQFLKVDTQGPERLNRRVAFLNVTRLMADR
jgi:outer membrane protein OmpA-like peptidoglycan-associated protein